MGKGTNVNSNEITRTFSWKEIHEHGSKDDRWIVVDGLVYDITRFQKKHPGGAKIIGHFAGQDATEVWRAMHNDKDLVQKYMKSICIGAVEKEKGPTKKKDKTKSLQEDFETLRQNAIKMGFFKVNPWFFIAHLAHILILEIIASYFAAYMGSTWQSFLLTSLIVCVYQAQAGWTQHDYGHQSVFNSTRLNHIGHHFTVGFIKGASSHWWNFRHFQHHAKPNVFKKDPDITVPQLFMVGENIPAKWGRQKRGKMPYNQQHNYFWILGPMGLLPIYFHLEVLYFVFKRRDWVDLSMIVAFFIRNQILFAPTFGGWGAFGLYMFARTIESFWFTFVTQMSHIPMEIDEERNHDWVTSQTISTTNVEPGLFNDWFTGHLNFQIEHHLFPTMPRHNYIKVMPMVKDLCKKHGVPYTCKPLGTAFADIVRSLKKSGEIWNDAYYHM